MVFARARVHRSGRLRRGFRFRPRRAMGRYKWDDIIVKIIVRCEFIPSGCYASATVRSPYGRAGRGDTTRRAKSRATRRARGQKKQQKNTRARDGGARGVRSEIRVGNVGSSIGAHFEDVSFRSSVLTIDRRFGVTRVESRRRRGWTRTSLNLLVVVSRREVDARVGGRHGGCARTVAQCADQIDARTRECARAGRGRVANDDGYGGRRRCW